MAMRRPGQWWQGWWVISLMIVSASIGAWITAFQLSMSSAPNRQHRDSQRTDVDDDLVELKEVSNFDLTSRRFLERVRRRRRNEEKQTGEPRPTQFDRMKVLNNSEFAAYVMANEPVVITRPAPCTKHPWNLDFIREKAGSDVVKVEVSKNNRFYSSEGLQKEKMTVAGFIDTFTAPNRRKDYYLAEEEMEQFPALDDDVVLPDFAEPLQLDKVQLWVGAGGQVSPLHQDQWENILFQIKGRRRVMLFEPFDADFLYPREGVSRHFSQLDPAHPDLEKFPGFGRAVKYEVELNAGEALYLPAFWWHQVHHNQSVNIAVNFWYTPNRIAELMYDSLLPGNEIISAEK